MIASISCEICTPDQELVVYRFENTKTNPLRIEQLLLLEIALRRMGDLLQKGSSLKSYELGPEGGLQDHLFSVQK